MDYLGYLDISIKLLSIKQGLQTSTLKHFLSRFLPKVIVKYRWKFHQKAYWGMQLGMNSQMLKTPFQKQRESCFLRRFWSDIDSIPLQLSFYKAIKF